MKRGSTRLTLAIISTAAILVGACTQSQTPGPSASTAPTSATATTAATAATGPKEGGTANIWLSQKLTDLNPLSGSRNAGWFIATMAFQDELYAIGADNKYEPRLAQSWDLSSDAKTYTFHLRPNLKWSDGVAFSSKDVLFSWKLYMTPDASDLAGALTQVKGQKEYAAGTTSTPAGLRAPDNNTFVIELDAPDATFLSNFYWPPLPIIPEHILGSVAVKDLKNHPFFRAPTVSMGPFQFVQWQTDQFVELKKNPNYYKPAHIASVFLREMDPNVAVTAIQKGDLDFMLVTSADDADSLAKLSNVKVESATSPGINKMTLTPEKPPFNDVRVRQAFMYAIDRQGIVNTVYKGRGEVVNTDMRAPGTVPNNLEPYAYNAQKAKDLLAAAKWDPNFVFKLSWPSSQKDRAASAQIIQANLLAVGVKSELTPLDGAAFGDAITKRATDGALVDGGLYNVDGQSVAEGVACDRFFPNGGNLAWYCNKQVDALFLEARSTTDEGQRNALYQQIAKIVNTEVSHVWLNAANSVYAHSSRLQGYKPVGDSTTFDVDIADWYLN